MSSGLLKGVLDSFVTEQVVMSSRMENAKLLAVCLLESSVENDDKIKLFDSFSETLHDTLHAGCR